MSTSLRPETMTRACAWAAGACAAAMLAIFFATGTGQDALQSMQSPEAYTRALLRHPAGLRAALAFDNVFIVLYLATFAGLGVLLARQGAQRLLLGTSLGALALLGVLDLCENFHFMVMLAGAEQGMPPAESEIRLQVWESLLKFHVGYIGVFLLGCVLPRSTVRERTLVRLCWFVNVPVGVLIYVLPPPWSVLLVLVRFAYFVGAFALVGAIFGEESAATRRFVAAGSGAPA
jgi:hypothetical protein